MEVKMKTRKWIWWTLTTILTIVVLGFTGMAGYRVGLMQGTRVAQTVLQSRNADGKATTGQWQMPPQMRGPGGNTFGNFHGQDFGRGQSFDGRNFNRFDRRVGFPFFAPLFGLLSLAVLALLIWLGYKFAKNSGWRLTRVTVAEPITEEKPVPKRAKK
jgi:hypothetical protein